MAAHVAGIFLLEVVSLPSFRRSVARRFFLSYVGPFNEAADRNLSYIHFSFQFIKHFIEGRKKKNHKKIQTSALMAPMDIFFFEHVNNCPNIYIYIYRQSLMWIIKWSWKIFGCGFWVDGNN